MFKNNEKLKGTKARENKICENKNDESSALMTKKININSNHISFFQAFSNDKNIYIF
jgi:hypothetical protein